MKNLSYYWHCVSAVCLEDSQREEPTVAETKSTFVILPGAGEAACFAAQLMVRHSPPYFTRHIYIYSDLVIAHLSPICPLRLRFCVSGITTAVIRDVPDGWCPSIKAETGRGGREQGGALCRHLACHIHLSNIHSSHPASPAPKPLAIRVRMIKIWLVPLLKMGH